MKATSFYSPSRDSWFVRVDFENGDNTDLECEGSGHASQIEDTINEVPQLRDENENLRVQLAAAEERWARRDGTQQNDAAKVS